MQVDALAVRLRRRTPMEAADLGTRMCQSAAADIYRCLALAAIPVGLLAAASSTISGWLPLLVIWWMKPWLDRTILFVLSRAAFGQRTTGADLWRAQRQVWWRHLFHNLTFRRLSPWRALTQAAYQLEGSRIVKASVRAGQIRRRRAGSAFLVTMAFSLAEICVTVSLLSLAYWFAPEGEPVSLVDLISGDTPVFLEVAVTAAYAAAVFFLEPFYVAAGFAMYLTRRTELEAWDIEQEFKRAFV